MNSLNWEMRNVFLSKMGFALFKILRTSTPLIPRQDRNPQSFAKLQYQKQIYYEKPTFEVSDERVYR